MDASLQNVCQWLRRLGLGSVPVALVVLALAAFLPVRAQTEVRPAGAEVARLRDEWRKPRWAELLPSLAGRNLIAPSQVRAAVRATGTEAALLKKLRLQGVLDLGGQPVAYVQVEKEGLKVVHEGDKLLEFSVVSIKPGHVALSLDGVAVSLTH